MEVAFWNNWVQRIDSCSVSEIDSEISAVEADDSTPFVEKNLKLGYLYYSKDYLATATTVFKGLTEKIRAEAKNFDFIRENEKGLNVLRMGYSVEPDGCGGYEVVETGCGGCGPFWGCLGIATVMVICGIPMSAVFDYDPVSGGSGCLSDCTNGCCNCCADCYGCDIEFT